MHLRRDNFSYKKVGWAGFFAHHQGALRWAEKIAHPTSDKLSRVKFVAKICIK